VARLTMTSSFDSLDGHSLILNQPGLLIAQGIIITVMTFQGVFMSVRVVIVIAVLSFSTICFSQSQPSPRKTVMVRGTLWVETAISLNRNASIQGEAIAISEGLDKDEVKTTTKMGFAAYVPKNSKVQISNCKDAEIEVSADVGNFIPRPDGYEVYTAPKILKFKCLDVPAKN
jgi:hypothetical protein